MHWGKIKQTQTCMNKNAHVSLKMYSACLSADRYP